MCIYENADCEIYEDLMSIVYFPVSKIHLADNFMKENSNKDCVMNVKNIEISDELIQNLSGWQIYPGTESLGESSKRINGKVDFNVVRNPNNGPTLFDGPMNLALSVCIYIYTYAHFLSKHFSQDLLISFIFCMKLRNHRFSKLTGLNFFVMLSLARKWDKKAQNGPIFPFIHYCSIFLWIGSLVCLGFFYILHEVEGP